MLSPSAQHAIRQGIASVGNKNAMITSAPCVDRRFALLPIKIMPEIQCENRVLTYKSLLPFAFF